MNAKTAKLLKRIAKSTGANYANLKKKWYQMTEAERHAAAVVLSHTENS
jgi:hypothetical protein